MKIVSNSFYHRQNRRYQFSNSHSNDQLISFRVLRDLRLQNIIMYDFNKHLIDFFIRRFKQIAKIEKHQLMLRVLFFCLKNDALK